MPHRHVIRAAAGVAAALITGTAAQAADVGVSIQISQPGVYGRIDIGQFPRPQVVVAQPVIIAPAPPQRERVIEKVQPVYLWVPPGHRKNWRKHCRDYGACGVPVLFVDDRWYDDHVHPRGKDKRKDKDKGHGKGQGKGKDD